MPIDDIDDKGSSMHADINLKDKRVEALEKKLADLQLKLNATRARNTLDSKQTASYTFKRLQQRRKEASFTVPQSSAYIRRLRQEGSLVSSRQDLLFGNERMIKGLLSQTISQLVSPQFETLEQFKQQKLLDAQSTYQSTKLSGMKKIQDLAEELEELENARDAGDKTKGTMDRIEKLQKDIANEEVALNKRLIEARKQYKEQVQKIEDPENQKKLVAEFQKSQGFKRLFSISTLTKYGLAIGGTAFLAKLLAGLAVTTGRRQYKSDLFKNRLTSIYGATQGTAQEALVRPLMRSLGASKDYARGLIGKTRIFEGAPVGSQKWNENISMLRNSAAGLPDGVPLERFLKLFDPYQFNSEAIQEELIAFTRDYAHLFKKGSYKSIGNIQSAEDARKFLVKNMITNPALGDRLAAEREMAIASNELKEQFKKLATKIAKVVIPALTAFLRFLNNPIQEIDRIKRERDANIARMEEERQEKIRKGIMHGRVVEHEGKDLWVGGEMFKTTLKPSNTDSTYPMFEKQQKQFATPQSVNFNFNVNTELEAEAVNIKIKRSVEDIMQNILQQR